MKRELPKIFANKIDKKLENNKNFSVTYSDEKQLNNESNRSIKLEKNINQKINEIFSSPKYVYKADVIITTNDGTIERRIIGKNGDNLITIENELINIWTIKDIKFKE